MTSKKLRLDLLNRPKKARNKIWSGVVCAINKVASHFWKICNTITRDDERCIFGHVIGLINFCVSL